MTTLTADQTDLQSRVRELAENEFAPNAAKIDLSEEYPWDSIAKLRDAGFMGMTIPRSYGGKGRSCHDCVLVIEEIARCCATMGRIAVESNMGAVGAVMAYGSEKQKRLAAEHQAGQVERW